MSSHEVSPRNRAERRLAAKKGRRAQAVGAALTAGSAALAMGATWLGPGVHAAGAATTLHVTSLNDTGAGTLRDQVAAASSGDTIDFQVTGTILLTSGDIAFNKDLTFTGPGATALTISGNDNSRVFDVTGGSAVTISGLTFVHGSSNDGGAVRGSGPVTISDSVFDHNVSSDDGGAVIVDGALSVTSSTFTSNSAADWGGAIFAHAGSFAATISGSTFTGNEAGDAGGALALQERSSVAIDSTGVSGNTAEHGGGLELYNNGSQVIGTSTFSGNHATDGDGGGIDLYSSDSFSISSSTVSGNDSADTGGGISLYAVDGPVAIDATAITDNNSAESGGGVYARYVDGPFTLTNSSVSGNYADGWGGGLYLGDMYGGVSVINTTIAGNTASSGGGGVQLWGDGIDAAVTVAESTISGNTSDSGGGGGWIQWNVPATTTFANSTISGNTTSSEGGGLYLYANGSVHVEMSTVTGNTSAETTGGIFLYTEEEVASASGSRGHHEPSAKADAGSPRGGDDDGAGRAARSGGNDVHAAAALPTAEVTGSIVWGNSGNDIGLFAAVTLSHDVLGTVASGIVQTDAGGNLTGVDPLLGPLQNNGGATATHALLPGSPAKDTGPDPVPDFPGNEFDQRGAGFDRVVDGRSDIGAFEVQRPAPAPDAIVITPKFTG